MKLVDRNILGDLGPTFLLAVTLFSGLILIAAGPLLSLLAQAVSIWAVIQVMVLYLPQELVLAFPMGMVIAVILGFTRLSSESEAVAMFASGISFYRMLKPTAAFALAMTVLALLINNSVEPAAARRIADFKNNLASSASHTTKPLDIPSLHDNGKLEASVHIEGGWDEQARALRQVTIVQYDPATAQPVAVIYARQAKWLGGLNWQLEDGYFFGSNGVKATFPAENTLLIAATPEAISALKVDPDTLTFGQLARTIARLRVEFGENNDVRELEVSLWDKLSVPLACFVFALVGAPLALRPQRGATRGVAFAWGIGIILCYYALFKYMDVLGAGGRIDPAFAAFVPNLLGLALAAYLVSRVTT